MHRVSTQATNQAFVSASLYFRLIARFTASPMSAGLSAISTIKQAIPSGLRRCGAFIRGDWQFLQNYRLLGAKVDYLALKMPL
jgi:hypothetical protein